MNANESARYAAADLHAFCAQALERAGARPGDAAVVAEGLVAADLRGVHSHGALRIGVYVDRLRAGSINPRAELKKRSPALCCRSAAQRGRESRF